MRSHQPHVLVGLVPRGRLASTLWCGRVLGQWRPPPGPCSLGLITVALPWVWICSYLTGWFPQREPEDLGGRICPPSLTALQICEAWEAREMFSVKGNTASRARGGSRPPTCGAWGLGAETPFPCVSLAPGGFVSPTAPGLGWKLSPAWGTLTLMGESAPLLPTRVGRGLLGMTLCRGPSASDVC